jgi:membrane protein
LDKRLESKDESMKIHKEDDRKRIPRFSWKRLFIRTKDKLVKDNIRVIAAGVAFYFFLALFPSLVAVISGYGYLTDTSQIHEHVAALTKALPEGVHDMLSERLKGIAEQSRNMLGWEAVLSFLISFWIANLGTKTLFDGINIVYNYEHQRSFLKQNAVIMLFTLIGLVVSAFGLAVVIGFPAIGDYMGLPKAIENLISWSRWVVLAALTTFTLAFIYKYAPARHALLFKNVIRGASFAVGLWIVGSMLFTFYVSSVNIFEQNYGSEAAVIILMLWFYLTSFVILLGAEINSQLEKRSGKASRLARHEEKREPESYEEGRRAA